MEITVVLFAAYREILGRSRVTIATDEDLTVEDIFWRLAADQPLLASLRPSTSFAVNREIVEPDTVLRPGDEVALLQPVSGG